MNEESIFAAALEKKPSERAAYLDTACQGDERLRRDVQQLLDAHGQAGCFLESPLADVPPTISHDSANRMGSSFGDAFSSDLEGPGATVDRYKLLQRIGEGGMGVVYMAEQTEPVNRRVALKIIKPGMDTKQVIARFEAERQALAMMDHNNIARVLDAGTTTSGHPYFVMELVDGVPITEYCDKHKLPTNERLRLFLQVCDAVQHAHQKGIIHRDIKPSNVMVASHDGRPVPKVIDFGVAKATNQRLTEITMFTDFGQIVGTLEYMSPEQAEWGGLDIDTRTDIYALGVLLYELLTSTTPIRRERLRNLALDKALRTIRDEEPVRPSSRLSESGDNLLAISADRQSEPKRLCLLVRGDLDWIVMKSLDKDRTRRYETADGFAADVQRYLNDEPVLASPPSALYRLRKFTRKHRAAVFAFGSLAFALFVSLVVAGWTILSMNAMDTANAARRAAEEARHIAVVEREKAIEAQQAAEEAADRERAAKEAALAAKVMSEEARRRAENAEREALLQREEAEQQRMQAEKSAMAARQAEAMAEEVRKRAVEQQRRTDLALKEEREAKEAALLEVARLNDEIERLRRSNPDRDHADGG